MNRKQRLAKKAKAYRNRIEREDLIVQVKPKIYRAAYLRIQRTRAHKVETYNYILFRENIKRQAEQVNAAIVGVRRLWVVRTNKEEQQWENLVMAQAHRDGLDFHYARHLMTQGTAAEGL